MRTYIGKSVQSVPLGKCPCGRDIHGVQDKPIFGVIHEMPYCDKFIKLEPDEFLAYVRRSRGIPDPGEA